jgi:hypothetical protein
MRTMINGASYDERVALGKAKEQQAIDLLRSKGVVIQDPTAREDMYDKIDGWVMEDGKRLALQVKVREGGDDIIFEIMKDIDRDLPGRDSVSKAHYYLVVDRKGVARMFLTEPIKTLAQHLLKVATALSSKQAWQGIGWQMKITVDKAHGNRKLMAYMNPGLFKCLGEWTR